MNITTKRIKNEDGSYSVTVLFEGTEFEVLNAMNEFEEIAEKIVGRQPDLKVLKKGNV